MIAGARGSGATANLSTLVPDYDPLTISDEDLKALPPAERGAVYKARAQARAAGGGAPPPGATVAPAAAAAPSVGSQSGGGASTPAAPAAASPAAAPAPSAET